jgi:hypothetical protein
MRFVSWNVNGIRAVANKGLMESLKSLEADVIGFQETKATEEQVAEVLQPMVDAGWHLEASSAERRKASRGLESGDEAAGAGSGGSWFFEERATTAPFSSDAAEAAEAAAAAAAAAELLALASSASRARM